MVVSPDLDRLAPSRRPAGRAAGTQRWRDLLFLHWPFPPHVVRERVPASLELDLHDGVAWVGLVPFAMFDVRPAWSPVGFDFPETNVRTYVHHRGRPGVFFFSLDAASRLAVAWARAFFHLPYHAAELHVRREGAGLHWYGRRADGAARMSARAAPGRMLGASAPGTLEHFLIERYLFFVEHRGRVRAGQVHHAPYEVAEVGALEVREESFLEAAGFARPTRAPGVAHYAAGVDVEVFGLA